MGSEGKGERRRTARRGGNPGNPNGGEEKVTEGRQEWTRVEVKGAASQNRLGMAGGMAGGREEEAGEEAGEEAFKEEGGEAMKGPREVRRRRRGSAWGGRRETFS